MDLIVTILPVVTKDLPISPRFTPYIFFYRDASSALLQLVNEWLNFLLIINRGFTVPLLSCTSSLSLSQRYKIFVVAFYLHLYYITILYY